MVAEAIIQKEKEMHVYIDQINEKTQRIQELEDLLKSVDEQMLYKDQELNLYRETTQELQWKVQLYESAESNKEYEIREKELQLASKEKEIENVRESLLIELAKKEGEILNLNQQILDIQDEKLEYQSRVENTQGKEHLLQEDLIRL